MIIDSGLLFLGHPVYIYLDTYAIRMYYYRRGSD